MKIGSRGLVCALVCVTSVLWVTMADQGLGSGQHLGVTLQLQPPGAEFLETRSPVGSHAPGEVRFYFGYQLPLAAKGLVAAAVVGRSVRVTGCVQGSSLAWTPMGKVTQGNFQGYGFFVSQGCKPNANEVVLTLHPGVSVSKTGDLLDGTELVWVA